MPKRDSIAKGEILSVTRAGRLDLRQDSHIQSYEMPEVLVERRGNVPWNNEIFSPVADGHSQTLPCG